MYRSHQDVNDRQPAKHHSARADRACAACRIRKQRCILATSTDRTACQRCIRSTMPCSFETEPADASADQPGPTRLAQMVVELQKRINQHETRIAGLEDAGAPPRKHPRLVDQESVNTSGESVSIGTESDNRFASLNSDEHDLTTRCFDMSMEQLELRAPIATLRSLGAASAAQGNSSSNEDPITLGLLTKEEASRAYKIYFDHCHCWAPVLSHYTHVNMDEVRKNAPTLFLSIMAIGARFWGELVPGIHSVRLEATKPYAMHSRYSELIKLLDKRISHLVLRPRAADASLSAIQALLLYLQWMPYDLCAVQPDQGQDRGTFQSRYNEMSSWAVFGLALRYATFCGIERNVALRFNEKYSSVSPSQEDLDTMRVWLNMVTYDCNLTLTSDLPASLDPRPMKVKACLFSSDKNAQLPGDIRYAALIELACIIHEVRHSRDSIKNRDEVLSVIGRANADFGRWERKWSEQLGETEHQKVQMPFTSVRWYRLALNSSLLRAVLSRKVPSVLPAWAPAPLIVSLTAASQILLSISTATFHDILDFDSRDSSSFPEGNLTLDVDARDSLHHAVDSTWISYTFAVTFLILCYVRRIIDDDVRLYVASEPPSVVSTLSPGRPRECSILHRLSRLAQDVFGCDGNHSATLLRTDYAVIVKKATSLVLHDQTDPETATSQSETIDPIQAFMDLMDDPNWGVPSTYEPTNWHTQS